MSKGFENAVALYSVRGVSVPPQPHVGTRRMARVARPTTASSAVTHSPPTTATPSAAGVTCANGPEPTAIDHAPRAKPDASVNPGSDVVTRPRTVKTAPGNRPSPKQTRVSSASGTSIEAGDSCASSAAAERGSARKVMPNALTKQTAASALVSARSAPTSGKFTRVSPGTNSNPSSSA